MENTELHKQEFPGEKPRRWKKICLLTAAIGLAAGVGISMYPFLFVGHFGVVAEGKLYRSRQPTGLQYNVLFHRRHIKSVINLRSPAEDPACFAKEQEICRENGIGFYSLPITEEVPALAKAKEILRCMETSPGPVLLHCDCGRNRSGMMSAVYRVARQGIPVEQAIQEELAAYNGDVSDRKKKKIVKLLEQFEKKKDTSPRSFAKE